MQTTTATPKRRRVTDFIEAPAAGGKTLKSFAQFSRDNPSFSEASLRWMKFCSVPGRKTTQGDEIPVNGFAEAFVKIGRRVYVDEDRFFAIARAQNATQGGGHV